MDKVGTVFFMAWLLCGCSIDSALDDWRACVVTVVALIVAIACIVVMSRRE